ncbi:MAG: methylenetetrahydrofolate reductase [Oscillospiraceae bacterium]|jgi:methylenetetrahydrofolate reductase (NADPH)|nr:methylenetetrahydrofolate reductase [Oscillospiraceae bacterium]
MLVKDLYRSERPVVSFEIFPPKKDADIDSIYKTLGQISTLSPDFISVTYGAGGSGNVNKTAEIAELIEKQYGIPALAHLTCVGADSEKIRRTLDGMNSKGIRNTLALRGDLPNGQPFDGGYKYAEDLILEIHNRGDFCVGAACYPEGHIDCDDLTADIDRLRRKQETGADFLISQLFFDNDIFFRFLDRARGGSVTLPISAGVMPILGRQQIERMIFMCGASLPSGIIKLLHKYEDSPNDLRKAGIEHAAKQLDGLLRQGADGVHIYTMNKPDIAEYCMRYIGRIK